MSALDRAFGGFRQAVAGFVEGAAVFAISRMWSDLVASFVFGLHAIPFCGGFLETSCTAEASASTQFLYALGCVVQLLCKLLPHGQMHRSNSLAAGRSLLALMIPS